MQTQQRFEKYAYLLAGLYLLFALRVLGQALVVAGLAPFLPPMDQWMSGLLSYPLLLTSQIALLILMAKVVLDLYLDTGYFSRYRPALHRLLQRIGPIYLGFMVLRYALHMALYPNERWFGGSIPVMFHCVLASFVIVWGHYYSAKYAPKPTTVSWRFKSSAAALILICLIYNLAPSAMAGMLGLPRAIFAVRTDRNVRCTMPDGIVLVADVYHPIGQKATPTVLIRIPYTKSIKTRVWTDVSGRMWAERGYTVVVQGTRGRAGSQGKFYPLLNEQADGEATLRWLKQQSWFNGKVFTWGGSAFGHTQWAMSEFKDVPLNGMFIYESSTNFYKMFYPGGAFSLQSALAWATLSHGDKDLPKWPDAGNLAMGARGFPVIEADSRTTGKDIPFFNDWIRHSSRDAYWEQIDGTARAARIQTPVMMVAGWFDPFLPTQLADYDEISKSPNIRQAQASRLIIGPWRHGGNTSLPGELIQENFRLKTVSLSKDWFDELNDPVSARPHPKVQFFVMGSNRWRTSEQWPPEQFREKSYYLIPGMDNKSGELALEPGSSQSQIAYEYDPQNPVPTAGGAIIGNSNAVQRQNNVESRPDVLSFSTPPLTKDVEIAGNVKATIFVSTDVSSTDFTAKLVDVHPNGEAFNVCDGIIRRSYSSVASHRTVQPQETSIELWPTAMVFKKHHRIRVEISSSNFPRYDANPNTGNDIATETNPIKAHQNLYCSPNYPSRLLLPVMPTEPTNPV